MMVRSSTLSYILLPLICLVLAVHAQSSIQVITLQDGGATTAYVSQQTAGVMEEMSSTRALKELLSGTYTSTALTVDAATVNSLLHQHIHNFSFTIVEGCMPSSITLNNDLVIIDPLCIQESRTPSPKLIYLFPVLEQQLDMAALYCSRNGISPMATRVLLRNGTNIASITAAANSAFKRYGLGLPSSSVVVSGATISDELLTSGTTFVVGLTTADVAPLVTFLEAHSDATVIVDFDDLTVLYDTFVTSFGTEYKSAMSRLLYTTNLPRWSQPAEQQTTAPPSVHSNEGWKEKCHRIFMDSREREGDHEACIHLKNMRAPPGGRYLHSAAVFRHAMREYYDGMPSEYRTPAGLRAFIALLVADVAAAELIHAPSQSISTPLYRAGRFSVAGIRFGPICDGRRMLSLGGAASVVNYAATDLSLWSYASILQVNITPVLGPVVSDFKASVSNLPEWNHKSPGLGTCSVVALALAVTLACFMLPRREKKIKKCDVTASALVHA